MYQTLKSFIKNAVSVSQDTNALTASSAAKTPPRPSRDPYPSNLGSPSRYAPLVKAVHPANSAEDRLTRIISAASTFLDLDRVLDTSPAPKVAAAHYDRVVPIANVSARALLTAKSSLHGRENAPNQVKSYEWEEGIVKVNLGNGRKSGNEFVYSVGPYEALEGPSVLKMLRTILNGHEAAATPNIQKLLFKSILDKMTEGKGFTKEELLDINPMLADKPDKILDALLRSLHGFCYLVCILEITRHPPYEASEGYKSKAAGKTLLCQEIMLVTTLMTLRLLEAGALSIEDVYSSDAPYGVPTGENLRALPDAIILGKTELIYQKYLEHFHEKELKEAKESGLELILTSAGLHNLMLGSTASPTQKETPSHSKGVFYSTPQRPKRGRDEMSEKDPEPTLSDEDDPVLRLKKHRKITPAILFK